MVSLGAALAFSLPSFVSAYSWNFKENPEQCTNLTIEISGTGGKPPYSVLLVPFGPTPFANNTEVRRIVEQKFASSSATDVSFQLKYPANSQFVGIVSDASGFGSGGTSVAAQVTSSDDTSCYDPTKDVSPPFTFSLEPDGLLVQCQSTRIYWNKTEAQGTPNFLGVIPGGESFSIPNSTITDVSGLGTGFSWTPSIRGGTTLILVGGDDRGNGSAGSILVTMGSGTSSTSNNCLSNDSPSSTPGSPAGGSYPTSSTGAGTSGGNTDPSSGSSTNIGAIVGGVVGGIAFLIAILLFLLFLRRRRRVRNRQNEKPVDLLHEDDGDDAPANRNELPQYYQPEPFIVPDPTATSADGHTTEFSGAGRPSGDTRRISGHSGTSRTGTPDILGAGSSTSASGARKGGAPRPLRPVNIIQHDDAGPSEAPKSEEPEETIELPPAYTNIRS